MKRWAPLGRLGLSVLIVAGFLAFLIWLAPGDQREIPQTTIIAEGVLCGNRAIGAACEGSPVTLPTLGETGNTLRFRFELPAVPPDQAGPMALHFPRFSEGLDVYLNGHLLLQTAPAGGPYWHWNRPAYLRVQPVLLAASTDLELVLHSAPISPPVLAPFQFGPDLLLYDVYRARAGMTRDVAWFGLLLAVLCTVGLAALALARRRDRVYLWAALAGGSAAILSLHYGAFRPPLPEALWLSVWTSSPPLLVASLHRFVRRFLRRRPDLAETLTLAYAVCATALMFLVPVPYLLLTSALVHAGVLMIALYLLSLLIRDRNFTTPGRFVTLYLAMCLTAALAIHDAAFLYIIPAPVSIQLGQFMPLIFMFVTGWLVVVQLSTALARQEALAERMRGRVSERTRALRRIGAQLEESQRATVLAQERQRIMMDLHDGVGGHLANVLAGLRQKPLPDPQLRDALEEAQTDLGLMVDSLYNPGDVVSLLAALRARLEPTLERQGLKFDWQVEEAPHLPDPTPTKNINLLRIVQEFVTNTVKHANARHITVRTGRSHLVLSDDGGGFDIEAVPDRGHGLRSQRRRAEAIGATLSIKSGDWGCQLRLTW